MWIMSNMTATKSASYVQHVLATGVTLHLAAMLADDTVPESLKGDMVHIVGNIACDLEEGRDEFCGVMMPCMVEYGHKVLKRSDMIAMLLEVSWAVTNMCRGMKEEKIIRSALTLLPLLVFHEVGKTVWSLVRYLSLTGSPFAVCCRRSRPLSVKGA